MLCGHKISEVLGGGGIACMHVLVRVMVALAFNCANDMSFCCVYIIYFLCFVAAYGV